jgi:hypothetical protein
VPGGFSLAIGVLGEADAARLGDALKPRRTVDPPGSRPQGGDGRRGYREAIGEVLAVARVKCHCAAVALGENAEAVVAGRGKQGSKRFNWRCNSPDADMAA